MLDPETGPGLSMENNLECQGDRLNNELRVIGWSFFSFSLLRTALSAGGEIQTFTEDHALFLRSIPMRSVVMCDTVACVCDENRLRSVIPQFVAPLQSRQANGTTRHQPLAKGIRALCKSG